VYFTWKKNSCKKRKKENKFFFSLFTTCDITIFNKVLRFVKNWKSTYRINGRCLYYYKYL